MPQSLLIVFDVDGVLVDPTDSYRATTIATVKHFTGQAIGNEIIQEYKNRGGWNNDWELAHRLTRECGVEIEYPALTTRFQEIFWGNGSEDGYILREKWLAGSGVLERLAECYQLAIFTGRLRRELEATLGRFAPGLRFAPIVTTDDIVNQKPAPDGLLKAAALAPDRQLLYLGDTVDDARSARAAGVPFIGVAPRGQYRYDELAKIFEAEGAIDVVESVNELEHALLRWRLAPERAV